MDSPVHLNLHSRFIPACTSLVHLLLCSKPHLLTCAELGPPLRPDRDGPWSVAACCDLLEAWIGYSLGHAQWAV